MKSLSIILFLLAGGFGVLAISNIQKDPDPSIGTWLGTFIIPALLAWWGKIAFDRASKSKAMQDVPNPESHVRCPDCKELVMKQARVCKHCKAALVPSEASQETPSK